MGGAGPESITLMAAGSRKLGYGIICLVLRRRTNPNKSDF